MTHYTMRYLLLSVLIISLVGILMIPNAFAGEWPNERTVTVQNAPGSSVPGCEETNACFIPNRMTVDPGDIIEVEITGIGRLRNEVIEGEVPKANLGHHPTDSDEVRRIALGNDDRLPAHLP